MTLPKLLVSLAALLLLSIIILIILKKPIVENSTDYQLATSSIEIKTDFSEPIYPQKPRRELLNEVSPTLNTSLNTLKPHSDRIAELFDRGESKLPIVETLTYRSQVSWLKGRPAWLSDYAKHYGTSRHFIARSLTGKIDYFKKDIAEGDRFNVLRKDKEINFYLVVDTSCCRLWLYALDKSKNQRILLKDYAVGLGRKDETQVSGLLTPFGQYTLGERIAIYKPKMMGYHKGKKIEMIQVFGTRWIPFEKEVSSTTRPAKGFGIHGVPWKPNEKGELIENVSSIGHYLSDGCIRMATKDIEELFAIIITKPTIIELVDNFHQAKLPGKEN